MRKQGKGQEMTTSEKDRTDNEVLRKGRYLLLLDILGFRKMIETLPAQEIYAKINSMLDSARANQFLFGSLRFIYYSDTLLMYSDPPGYERIDFTHLLIAAGAATTGLLAKHIPVRGALAFGDFVVAADWGGSHQIFFGKAHIEAYDAEKEEKWIGVKICRSAYKHSVAYNTGALQKDFDSGRLKKREQDGALLFSPLPNLVCSFWNQKEREESSVSEGWDCLGVQNDLRAFRFLYDQHKAYSQSGDTSSSVAMKYRNTIEFLRDGLPEGCFEWAEEASAKLPPE